MAVQKRNLGPEASYEEQSINYSKLYHFSNQYLKFVRRPQAYLLEAGVSSSEAHLVTVINGRPGLTVSEVAKLYGCTSGAISQNVGKLEKKGYLERRKQEGNDKLVHLFVTPLGEELARTHQRVCSDSVRTFFGCLKDCTDEEIAAFFKVIDLMRGQLV